MCQTSCSFLINNFLEALYYIVQNCTYIVLCQSEKVILLVMTEVICFLFEQSTNKGLHIICNDNAVMIIICNDNNNARFTATVERLSLVKQLVAMR